MPQPDPRTRTGPRVSRDRFGKDKLWGRIEEADSHRSSCSSGVDRGQTASPNDSSESFWSARRSWGASGERTMLRRMLARLVLAARAGLGLLLPTAKRPRRCLVGRADMIVVCREEKGKRKRKREEGRKGCKSGDAGLGQQRDAVPIRRKSETGTGIGSGGVGYGTARGVTDRKGRASKWTGGEETKGQRPSCAREKRKKTRSERKDDDVFRRWARHI